MTIAEALKLEGTSEIPGHNELCFEDCTDDSSCGWVEYVNSLDGLAVYHCTCGWAPHEACPNDEHAANGK